MRKSCLTPVVILGLLFSIAMTAEAGDGFRSLFNGKTLDGWIQHGGKAKYEIDNGEIIGTSVPNTPNSFLCTEKLYGDFELELEFKVDPLLNSGVQIRSQVYDKPTEVKINGKKRKFPADRAVRCVLG